MEQFVSSYSPDESVQMHPAHEEPSEVMPCVTEIIVTCTSGILRGMVAAYETAIEQAAGEYPLLVLWWGCSQKNGYGTIVLEWPGKVPASLLHDLAIDDEVLEYVLYEDQRVFDEPGEELSSLGAATQGSTHPIDAQESPTTEE